MDPLCTVDSDRKLHLPVHNLQNSSPSQEKQGPASKEDISAMAACNFVGYTTPTWVIAVYTALVITTGGLAWVVIQCLPQRPLWSMRQCPLNQAEHVQVKMICGDCKLTKVFRHSHEHNHSASQSLRSRLQPVYKLLVLNLMVYVYDPQADTFKPLPDMPEDLPQQILHANEALTRVAAGGDWSLFNTLASWSRKERASLYGTNNVAAGCPNLGKMFAAQLCQAIFFVQFAEIAFITYEDDYKLAALLASVTLASCFSSVYRLYQSRLKLYQSVSQSRLIPIVQLGRVRAVNSHRLVPGDVVVLLPGKATCDMVLLRGNCLVEESLLSGEAAQVRKSSIGGLGLGGYHPNTHHTYTVHSGTTVEQVWNEEDAEDEVLAMVVRTGLHTSMGGMMRQVDYNAMPARNQLIRDYFFFCAGHLILQIASFGLCFVKADSRAILRGDPEDTFQRVVDIFIAAWPMSVPTVLIVALAVRVVKLNAEGIDTLQPAKLIAAAYVEAVCFDKTGTLTANTSDLHGMLPVVGGQFLSLQSDAVRWPVGLKQAAALCNSLTLISKSKVVGELDERRAFNAVEARFLDRNVVTLPLQTTHSRKNRQATFNILKRFEFESALMRSGVVAVEQHKSKQQAVHGMLIIKGAAAVLERMVGTDRLPPNYRKLVDEWSGQSYRVLAVAMAQLPHLATFQLARMSQQQVEDQAGRFQLLGLIILSNHINSHSKATVQQLQERGGLRLMMVTGDYYHTALSVARGVGMVPSDSRVVIIQTHSERQGTLAKPVKSTAEAAEPQHKKTALAVSFAVSDTSGGHDDASDDDIRALGGCAESQAKAPKVLADWLQSPIKSQLSPAPSGVSVSGAGPSQVQLLQSQAESLQSRAWSAQSQAEPLSSQEQAELSPAQSAASFIGRGQSRTSLLTPGSESATLSHKHIQFADESQQSASENAREGLSFVLDNGDQFEDGDTLRAFNTISQGGMRCCITGPAFAYLVQQPNQALVQAVALNTVAFTRMKSNQKGQLLDLLGRRGLHHMLNGQRQHIPGLGISCMYCGDGINDLAALAAADVGMAVGAADASAAATFSDKHYSVAGVCTVLREARALHVISVALVKFMVLYQLADQNSVSVSFFIDGSGYTNDQSDAFDFIALTIGIIATLRPAASVLFPNRHLPRLSHRYSWFAMVVTAVVIGIMYAAAFNLLDRQPWYMGGNGEEAENPVITLVWVVCLVQLVVPAVMFCVECYPYCKKANKAEMVLVGALLIYINLCCLLGPDFYDAHGIFEFYHLPFNFTWKLEVICLACSIGYAAVLVLVRIKCYGV